MSVTFANSNLGLTIYDPPQPGQWDTPLARKSWFGVGGEATLVGKAKGRPVTMTAHLRGYASLNAVETAINSLQNLRGTFGSLVVDLGGGDATTYTLCTFESCTPTEMPWLDGSGVNGWQCGIRLEWRQSNG